MVFCIRCRRPTIEAKVPAVQRCACEGRTVNAVGYEQGPWAVKPSVLLRPCSTGTNGQADFSRLRGVGIT